MSLSTECAAVFLSLRYPSLLLKRMISKAKEKGNLIVGDISFLITARAHYTMADSDVKKFGSWKVSELGAFLLLPMWVSINKLNIAPEDRCITVF